MEEIILTINNKEYLFDAEKAKELGILKEKITYPKTWEEYKEIIRDKNCWLICAGGIVMHSTRTSNTCYDTFSSEEEAEAFVALGKLINLRDAWIGNWKPNWKDRTPKYTITNVCDAIKCDYFTNSSQLLSFPTEEMRNEFYDAFKDLIEEAKMLL